MLLAEGEDFAIHHGDAIIHMEIEMPEASIDFAMTSPAFPALFAYSDSESDIGNVDSYGPESKVHLAFFYRRIFRVLKPGRVFACHVMQIPGLKRVGGEGIHDFRGLNIRLGQRVGFIYDGEVMCSKNPQSEAIRTRSRRLQFAGLEADRSKSAPCLPDYIIKFRKPGENAVMIDTPNQVSRNQWIDWAEACWSDIRWSRTLNTLEAKDENDTRHICAFPLDICERCIRLWSNPGELVYDPFTGIGSTGYAALGLDRKFYGTELKDSYHETAVRNCQRAIDARTKQKELFAAT